MMYSLNSTSFESFTGCKLLLCLEMMGATLFYTILTVLE